MSNEIIDINQYKEIFSSVNGDAFHLHEKSMKSCVNGDAFHLHEKSMKSCKNF